MESQTLLPVGAPAPAFSVDTDRGTPVSLEQFRGNRSVLLMFYPKDDTPGCTRQMCLARDEGERYAEAGIERFGVNPGDAASHGRFVSKYELDFPLLVDADREIARAYGVLRENGGVARATYVIDPEGRIAFARAGAHDADTILAALGAG